MNERFGTTVDWKKAWVWIKYVLKHGENRIEEYSRHRSCEGGREMKLADETTEVAVE